ncbi:MAG: HDOD domain-containing protein [bacterium]|nr:HDOD domain-containing protein [bacterium]
MNEFEARLLESAKLPTLVSVAQRLLGLLRDDLGSAQLAEAISVDPAIVARLLSQANSPMYGMSREVKALPDALNRLGLNTVRSIALSFSFADRLRDDEESIRVMDQLWRASLMTALAARRLAQECGGWEPEEAFSAGLLCDAAVPWMYEVLPEYRDLARRFLAGEADLIELERSELESDHARVGALLLNAWNLPKDLCRTIGQHHRGGGASAKGEGPVALLDGAWLCARVMTVEGFAHEASDLAQRLQEITGIAPAVAERVLDALPEELRETAEPFEIPPSRQRSFGDLLEDAGEILRNIAIEADRSAYLYAAATGGGRSGFEDIRQALKPTLGLDESTNLLQHRSMERLLEAYYARAGQRRCALGMLVLEIEQAKDPALSSENWPVVLEQILSELGDRLQRVIRDEDDLARYCVDKIAILMPDCGGEDLLPAGRRIREQIEFDEIEFSGAPEGLRIVIGASFVVPRSSRGEFGGLLESLDGALERARVQEDRLSL